MNKIGAFSFDSMTDKELRKMMEVINYELTTREERKRKLRDAWVAETLDAYLCHPNAICKVVGGADHRCHLRLLWRYHFWRYSSYQWRRI